MNSLPLAGATVVFDLDGTLIDTAPDLLRALNQTLAHAGLPPAPPDAVRAFVGHGARMMIERAAAHTGADLARHDLSALTETFVEFYAADIANGSRPFAGALAALDALAADGALLAICTNKRGGLARQLLSSLGLDTRFAAIVGSDDAPARKPDPAHFVTAVQTAGGVVDRSIMVGDSLPDVAAAHAAGRPALAARFGYAPEGADQLGADAVFDAYAELPDLVRRYLR